GARTPCGLSTVETPGTDPEARPPGDHSALGKTTLGLARPAPGGRRPPARPAAPVNGRRSTGDTCAHVVLNYEREQEKRAHHEGSCACVTCPLGRLVRGPR